MPDISAFVFSDPIDTNIQGMTVYMAVKLPGSISVQTDLFYFSSGDISLDNTCPFITVHDDLDVYAGISDGVLSNTMKAAATTGQWILMTVAFNAAAGDPDEIITLRFNGVSTATAVASDTGFTSLGPGNRNVVFVMGNGGINIERKFLFVFNSAHSLSRIQNTEANLNAQYNIF